MSNQNTQPEAANTEVQATPRIQRVGQAFRNLGKRAANDVLDTTPRQHLIGALTTMQSVGETIAAKGRAMRIKKDENANVAKFDKLILEYTARRTQLNLDANDLADRFQAASPEVRESIQALIAEIETKISDLDNSIDDLYVLRSKAARL